MGSVRLISVKEKFTPSRAPHGVLVMELVKVSQRPDLGVLPSAESHRHQRVERLTDGEAPGALGRCRLHQVQEIIKKPQVCKSISIRPLGLSLETNDKC